MENHIIDRAHGRGVKFGLLILLLCLFTGCQQLSNSAGSNVNTGNQTSTNAESIPVVEKTNENKLFGTWVGTPPDEKLKMVFTENELTIFDGEKEPNKSNYRKLDEETIELFVENTKIQMKVKVEGDELTATFDGKTTKFKRESGEGKTETAQAKNSDSSNSAAENPPAAKCFPTDNQIAIYKDPKFAGDCKTLGLGEYANTKAIDFEDDSISSVKVGRYVVAVFFSDFDYRGTCQEFKINAESLEGTKIQDNTISSLKVIQRLTVWAYDEKKGVWVDIKDETPVQCEGKIKP